MVFAEWQLSTFFMQHFGDISATGDSLERILILQLKWVQGNRIQAYLHLIRAENGVKCEPQQLVKRPMWSDLLSTVKFLHDDVASFSTGFYFMDNSDTFSRFAFKVQHALCIMQF